MPESTAGWGSGYPVGTAYAATLQPDLAPDHLDLALVISGRLPPARKDGFRYLELGCGFGTGLVALAALYPQGQFSGVDFLPLHVAEGRRLARAARLDNVVIEEAAFDVVALQDGPCFDYVVLHGVFTWISAANRAAVVEILRRRVAPGGVVYVGCNAMPAWAVLAPARRIARDVLAGGGGIAALREAVGGWAETEGGEPGRAFWARVSATPDAYLLHELGAEDGGALWSAELDAALAPAKLGRVGSTKLAQNIDALCFSPEKRARLRTAEAQGWASAARDILSNASFHHAIYARGAPLLSSAEADRFLRARHVAAAVAEDDARPLAAGIEAALAAATASGARPVADVADAVAATLQLEPRKALQAVIAGLATGRLAQVRDSDGIAAARDEAARFNAVARQRLADGVPLPGLASARLGAPVLMGREMQAAAFGLSSTDDPAALAALALAGFDAPHVDPA